MTGFDDFRHLYGRLRAHIGHLKMTYGKFRIEFGDNFGKTRSVCCMREHVD